MNSLTKQVKKYRIILNSNQSDFARRLGVSLSTYQKLESGKLDFRIKHLMVINSICEEENLEKLIFE